MRVEGKGQFPVVAMGSCSPGKILKIFLRIICSPCYLISKCLSRKKVVVQNNPPAPAIPPQQRREDEPAINPMIFQNWNNVRPERVVEDAGQDEALFRNVQFLRQLPIREPGADVLPDTARDAYQGLMINREAVNLAPDVRNLAENIQQIAFHNIDIDLDGLLNHWDILINGDPKERKIMEEFVEFVKNPLGENGDYVQGIQLYVKNIIHLLGRADIDDVRKRDTLQQLVEAKKWCNPRRFMEAEKQFENLFNAPIEAKEVLLKYVQKFKEEGMLDLFHGGFHTLNGMRNDVGAELGLNTSRVGLNDFALPRFWGRGYYLDYFNRFYTPQNLIDGIQNEINIQANDTDHSDENLKGYLTDLLQGKELKVEDLYDGITIKKEGVIILLKSIGILVNVN